ncbi:MAG: efflux RND transporter periplasmic adaptor subunit [Janthinobacterium lividum]
MTNSHQISRQVMGHLGQLLLLVLLLVATACQQAQPAATASAAEAAYYTCSMHPQVHAAGPGSCPICHMDLLAVPAKPIAAATTAAQPAAAVYTCPMHAQVHEAEPGSCPICGMDLVKTSARPAAQRLTSAERVAHPGSADLVLTAQQVELGNIKTELIGKEEVIDKSVADAPAPLAVLTGTVAADAQRTESVSSRVAGRVEHLYVRQTGQVLRRGAPLFSVYSEELQSLQREYVLALAQDRLVPGPTYQHFAEATAQQLRLLGVSGGQLRQLAASGRPSPLVTYYSPRTGTVQSLAVTQGQYVAQGSPLLTLTDLSRVWVEAQLLPADASRLPLGTRVAVQAAGQPQPLPGRVVFLSPELSGGSQITLARIEVANPGGRLRPGAQANVLLPTPAAALAAAPSSPTPLRVPQEAVLHDGAASYVWQQTGARQYRRLRVQVGEGTAATVPIVRGLPPGARVVVAGAYLLQSEFTLRQGAPDDHMSGMAM